ncbi:MAG: chaperone protein HtpG [Gemmatales bacterium]|nr:MAG: chaperone protein HtpG [Gemmatales bacterium]
MGSATLPFKTELKQILDIIIHSLYSHKEIFLRELISNASDAIDALRFRALTQPELTEGDENWKIKLIPDKEAGTLTVSDNGIGMTRDEIVENLGTIARSGTKEFLEALKKADAQQRPELIGQFGVGFYSAFMVAKKVEVISRAAGVAKDQAVRWQSTGEGEFEVETVEKETRGTDVILHLRDEDKEFLDEWRLRSLVRQYSDFIEHPIVMDVTREDENKQKKTVEETLNSRKAIWLRDKSEISEEEYIEFYKHLTHDTEPPAKTIHYSAEGAVEFRSLLYIPGHKTFDLLFGDPKRGVHLYIRRVFIMDDCEALLPLYLRFVRGVVDSPDLPLNVSREMLQQSAPLEIIRNNLTNRILKALAEMKQEEYDKYVRFFQELGVFLKEGVYHDFKNREQLADLLLFESTKTEPGKYTTLADYAGRMKDDQQEIYYLAGEQREQLVNSPYLESFRAKDQEVLLLTEPIDSFMVESLTEYKGKKLKAVDKGELAPGEIPEEKKKKLQPLVDYLKEKIPEVKDVRLSSRLKESAVCLVADDWAPGAHMERILKRIGQKGETGQFKKILEINPDHAVTEALVALLQKNPDDARLPEYGRLLYEQALIAEGSPIPDAAGFAQRLNRILAKDASS